MRAAVGGETAADASWKAAPVASVTVNSAVTEPMAARLSVTVNWIASSACR